MGNSSTCPESTIESANSNRRNFIRTAALGVAGAGVATTVLGGRLLPESTASSDSCTGLYVKCTFLSWDCIVVDGKNQNNGSLIKECGNCIYYCSIGPCSDAGVHNPQRALTFGLGCAEWCTLNKYVQANHSGEAIASARTCGSPNQFGLDFYTNYAKRVSITNSGKVGIGTVTPSSTLCVNGSISAGSTIFCSTAISGVSECGIGVLGTSEKGPGVSGSSKCCAGVLGKSNGRCGVGVSGSGCTGVSGSGATGGYFSGTAIGACGNSSTGTAVKGTTTSGIGVYGEAGCAGTGVYGSAVNRAGVYGTSSGSNGVEGYNAGSCGTVAGVKGYSPGSNTGVWGCSTKGIGVFGTANGTTGVPIVAKGVSGQTADLQQWRKGCTVKSVVTACGYFGVGNSSPTVPLQVCGSTCNSPTIYGINSAAGGIGIQGRGGGIGIKALSTTGSAVPLVAKGYSCQTAALQEWWKGCTPKSVVNACGYLGIGTLSASTPLDVVGSSPTVGTFKSSATSGDRSSVVQFANGDSTSVDWNVGVAGLCNSIKVPDGYFYVQHSTSATPAISVNKCNNHVGIGLANPCRVLCVNGRIHTSCGMGLGTQTINTTLAINGSLSMRSRQVSSGTTLLLSDYTVLANATSAAFTLTLPAVSSTAAACNGMVLFIKKIDSSTNTVTVATSGTDTIEGKGSIVLKKQYDSLQLISNNSSGTHEWFILQSAECGVAVS
jgi:hypothetical protein